MRTRRKAGEAQTLGKIDEIITEARIRGQNVLQTQGQKEGKKVKRRSNQKKNKRNTSKGDKTTHTSPDGVGK